MRSRLDPNQHQELPGAQHSPVIIVVAIVMLLSHAIEGADIGNDRNFRNKPPQLRANSCA